MPVDDDRILGATRRFEDDEVEASLRPRRLAEYIGQSRSKRSISLFVQAAKPGQTPSTTSCSTVRRAWVRRRWRTSSPTNWASASGSTSGPAIEGKATWSRS